MIIPNQKLRFGKSEIGIPIWDIPSLTWDMVKFGLQQCQIKIPIWDIPSLIWDMIIPNRNLQFGMCEIGIPDFGYPKSNLGHGQIWATTVDKSLFFNVKLIRSED